MSEEIPLTKDDIIYRHNMVQHLSDYLGAVAFAMIVKAAYPNSDDREYTVERIFNKWLTNVKMARQKVGVSKFDLEEDDTDDIKRILNHLDVTTDSQFDDAVAYARETMLSMVNSFMRDD